ncbi:Nucleoporin SEH1 [Chamberlinius hualienensis]
MFVTRSINADHKDLIHDVAYDFYGRRMATCSSDQSVKIWELGEDGQWACTANWKTHSGSVWKVTWAHPEFGQVLATCSFDRTAAVWEEIVGDGSGHERLQSHWVKRTSLVDSRTSVTDVRFAPRHMGLQLATCSSDGIVRIYEALDVMNLSSWTLQHEISCKISCSCVAWGPTRKHAPIIAVGSDDSNSSAGGKVLVYQFYESQRKWLRVETVMSIADPVHDIAFAPSLGRSFYLLAVASREVNIISLRPVESSQKSSLVPASQSEQVFTQYEIREIGHFDEHSATVSLFI